jgi:hypothetical protein
MTDQDLIAHYGGPAKLAEILWQGKDGGVQRVHNWIARGIPPKEKVARPDLFLIDLQFAGPAPTAESLISAAPQSQTRDPDTAEQIRETEHVTREVLPLEGMAK